MCLTLCDFMDCSTPGFPVFHYLPESAQTHFIELVMIYNYLILCHPLLLLPSIFPSIRVFSSKSALHISWPKDWSFSFSLSPSSEYSGLISFKIDWFDLLVVQGIVKGLLLHHNSKASIFQCSAIFMVQISYLYMTIGKTIVLIRWTFVVKEMSLLFKNTLSKFIIAIFPRSKHLLVSWLQSWVTMNVSYYYY